jgi:hypothetical protein
MTQRVSADTVLGDFDGVQLSVMGESYTLGHEGDSFWMEVRNPGSPLEAIRRPIVMSTGSHHMQVYWYPTGKSRIIGQLPHIWLKEDERWIPRNSAFLRPPPDSVSEATRWNLTCNKCHTTNARPRINNLSDMDTMVSEFGIACEACHGPAEEHVRKNRDPAHRYGQHLAGEPDDTIVNPKRLSHVLSSQVCGQCHAIFQFVNLTEFEHWKQKGFRYRPGDDLTDTRFFIHQGQEHAAFIEHLKSDPTYMERKFWSDGVIRMAGREYISLLGTPCFQRGEMSCLSCHSMHGGHGGHGGHSSSGYGSAGASSMTQSEDDRTLEQWADDQLKPDMRGNLACVQCHGDFAEPEALTAHTHHAPESPGSNCYNCHMPYTAYALLKAVRSHQLDTPSVATSLATGRPNGCNQCHLDQTLAWTAEHLEDWYGMEKPSLTPEEESVAASILWGVRGDATQRALMGWSMGWSAAQQASGNLWQAPFLAQLLVDPYEAVRFLAYRSLRSLPGFAELDYDFVGPEDARMRARDRVVETWKRRTEELAEPPTGEALLLDEAGGLREDSLRELLSRRDDRVIELDE